MWSVHQRFQVWAAAFRERVAGWEAAARELCRFHGLEAPPAARPPDA
jgi:hypothetical protein